MFRALKRAIKIFSTLLAKFIILAKLVYIVQYYCPILLKYIYIFFNNIIYIYKLYYNK